MIQGNVEGFGRLTAAMPVLEDVFRAAEVTGFLDDRALLHAGPPIAWQDMCGPMRGALECAVVYEGWADSYERARYILGEGRVRLASTHDHGFVGPVAGVVSPSMWAFRVKDVAHGNVAHCTMSEGMGRALRFGAQGDDVQERLKWMEVVLGPILKEAIQEADGIDLKQIILQSLEMGDECHNRHEAARLQFLRRIVPGLLSNPRPCDLVKSVFEFIAGNYYFFVNLAMAASKATMDSIKSVPGSTLVSAMARNGVDFGIRVAGLGDEWYTAPCNRIDGVYFDGFGESDANLDLGDSSITETAGLGAFAMAGAPAICRYIGGTPNDLVRLTCEMYEITVGEHPEFQIPALGNRGVPLGIDLAKVIGSRVEPVINSSIAHKHPGRGQIGAGIVRAPLECFQKAWSSLQKSGIPITGGEDLTDESRHSKPEGRRLASDDCA